MNHPRPDSLRDNGTAEHTPPVVVKFDDIPIANAPFAGICGMNPCRPPGIPVLFNAMHRNIIQPVRMLVIVTVKGKTGMGTQQLQSVFLENIGPMALKAWNVPGRDRPLLIVGKMLTQTFRCKLNLARIGAQLLGLVRAPFWRCWYPACHIPFLRQTISGPGWACNPL